MLARFWLECPLMKIPDEASIWLPGTVRSWNRFFGLSRPHRPATATRCVPGYPCPPATVNATSARFCARTGAFALAGSRKQFSIGACFHILA
jgi:hypothetical protein